MRARTAMLIWRLLALALMAGAFNIDTKQPLIHKGQPHTGFGYSIDFYHSGNENTLLVGAPFGRSNQRDVQRGGQVFKCDTGSNRCAEVIFDRTGNERRLNGTRLLPIEEKSYQMFGATVIASPAGGAALACAPHYKYFFSKFEVVEPVGTCFYATDNFNKIVELAPCRQEPARHGHHRFGYGMCGFSAAIPNNGEERLYISGPGVWYWQGATFAQSLKNVTDRPVTKEGPAPMDNFQLGYSTAAGDFNGDHVDDVVVGAPRANGWIGTVTIMDEKLGPIANLTDANGQRGQYFGAAVIATDLNGDGLDDLVVGAPFYTDYTTVLDVQTQEHKPQYDIGKVYVYVQTAGVGAFRAPVQIKGRAQWGRFGHALAPAGDLNGDGFNDFVVGAPYDGEDGRGAVYVFHGARDGVRAEPTQRILARDVAPDLSTFGFALSAGRDVDRNDYPDVAVGAMGSAKAVVLRTKPVIQITGFVKTTRSTINLDQKNCATEFGKLPCEKVRFCLKFAGKTHHSNVDVKVQVNLDAANKNAPRAFFSRKDLDRKRGVNVDRGAVSRDQPDLITQTLVLGKGREVCETYDVYITETVRDKISPILIAVNYTHVEKRAQPGVLEPAVDTTLPLQFVAELNIEKDCGEDNVCVPDLQVSALTTRDKFTIGTEDKTLTLNVTVRNQGEASFLTRYNLDIPAGFEYGGVENYDNKHKVSCTPAEDVDKADPNASQRFVCDVGNPLPANDQVDFGVKLTGESVDANQEFIEVRMAVNSTNAEEPGSTGDNDLVLRVPVEVKALLALIGRSNPEQVDYSIRNRTLAAAATFDFEVGPVVSHLFQVINRGPTVISGAKLDIFWPSFSDKGKPLLYLIDMPFVSDPQKARCQVRQGANVNSAGLAISNQHVPTQSTLGDQADQANYYADNGAHAAEEEDFEDDRVPYEQEDEPEYSKAADEDYEEYRRRKRAARRRKDEGHSRRQPDSLRRKLREQKHQMKEIVQRVKDHGQALEYRGPLNPSHLNCQSLNCTQISCDIDQLGADEYVLIEVFSRLWLNTLIDSESQEAEVSSLAFAQITSLPYAPKYTPPPQVIAVTTNVNPIDPESIGWGLPWWLWLLAILIGLLLLLLIIYCCWRCGFFKRNRPQYEKAQFNRESYDE